MSNQVSYDDMINVIREAYGSSKPTPRSVGPDVEGYKRFDYADKMTGTFGRGSTMRSLNTGLLQAGGTFAALGNRARDLVTGEDTAGDTIRMNEGVSEWKAERDPDRFSKALTGTTRSLATMAPAVPLAAASGPAAMAAMTGIAGTTTANESYTEARDAGLSPGKATAYAAAAGSIEAGVMTIFNKIGLGGTEAALASKAITQQGLKSAFGALSKTVAGEAAEEWTTGAAQDAIRKVFDVNADSAALFHEDGSVIDKEGKLAPFWQNRLDELDQTLLMGGAVHARSVAGAAKDEVVDRLPNAEGEKFIQGDPITDAARQFYQQNPAAARDIAKAEQPTRRQTEGVGVRMNAAQRRQFAGRLREIDADRERAASREFQEPMTGAEFGTEPLTGREFAGKEPLSAREWDAPGRQQATPAEWDRLQKLTPEEWEAEAAVAQEPHAVPTETAQPAAPKPKKKSSFKKKTFSQDDIDAAIQRAADEAADPKTNGYLAWASHAYRKFAEMPEGKGVSLEQFKEMAADSHWRQKIRMSRADLTSIYDPNDVNESEFRTKTGELHFIDTTKNKDSAEPPRQPRKTIDAESVIEQVFDDVDRFKSNLVSLADLRTRAGLDREEFDAAIQSLRRKGKMSLSAGNAQSPRQREAAIMEVDVPLAYATKETPAPETKPAPSAPRKTKEGLTAEQQRTLAEIRATKKESDRVSDTQALRGLLGEVAPRKQRPKTTFQAKKKDAEQDAHGETSVVGREELEREIQRIEQEQESHAVPTPDDNEQQQFGAFVRRLNAAGKLPRSNLGRGKITIDELWKAYRKNDGPATRDEFNRRLAEANKRGDIKLESSKLGDRASEIVVGKDRFHQVDFNKPGDADRSEGGYFDPNQINLADSMATVATIWKRWMSAGGLLPEGANKARVGSKREADVEAKEAAFTNREFQKAARDTYGRKISEQDMESLHNVLSGKAAPSTIPAAMRPVVHRMRSHIDRMSAALINAGAIDGKLAAEVGGNLGVYLNRSYRVFDDPNWARRVPEAVRNRAKAWLRAEYPQSTDDEIEGLIHSFLFNGKAAESPIAYLARTSIGSKDRSILMRRKDIPKPLRELWGEYREADVNYVRSIHKMAQLLGAHRMLTDIRNDGMGKYLFEQPTGDHHARIAADGNKALEPLDGLYTTQDIKRELAYWTKGGRSDGDIVIRTLAAGNAFASIAHTAYSPGTSARNFLSNGFVAMANGHWRINKFGHAFSVAKTDFLGGGEKAIEEYIKSAVRYGIVDQSIGANTVKEMIERANPGELSALLAELESLIGPNSKVVENTSEAVKTVHDKVLKLYGLEDDIWKIYAWENEKSRYRKAYPQWSEDQLNQETADIVRRTYPNYSDRGALEQEAFKKLPYVGPFVAFPMAITRSAAGTLAQTAKELSDPRTQGIGMQRAIGVMMVSLLPSAAAMAARYFFQIDRDEEEAMREQMPEWSKNSQILPLGKTADGKFAYHDISMLNPYAAIVDPIRALLRGEPDVAAKEFAEPFVSEKLLTSAILDLARNKDEKGRPVYNEQRPLEQQAGLAVGHIIDGLTPDWPMRLILATTGNEGPGGRKYDFKTEALSLLGLRSALVEPANNLYHQAMAFSRSSSEAKQIFNSTARQRGKSEAAIAADYKTSTDASRRIFDGFADKIAAAKRLGLSDQQVKDQLKAAGVSKENADNLIARKFTPDLPSEEIIKANPRVLSVVPEVRPQYVEALTKRLSEPLSMKKSTRDEQEARKADALKQIAAAGITQAELNEAMRRIASEQRKKGNWKEPATVSRRFGELRRRTGSLSVINP